MQTSPSVPEPTYNLWQKCGHWFVARFIGVQRVGTCSSFNFRQGRWQLSSAAAALGLFRVVPRLFYAEYQRYYPIVDVKDLRAVLNQDYPAQTVHLIAAADNNQRQVTSYMFDQAMLESLQHPCFLLPESLLLALSEKAWPTTMQIEADPDWFIYCGAQGVISQLPNALVNNQHMFRLAQGVSEAVPHVNIAADTLPGRYVTGLKHLSPKQLVTFFYRAKILQVVPDWRPLLVISSAVLMLHLLVSSWLINWQLNDRQTKIAALGPQMNELLTAQQQHQQLTAQIAAITTQQNSHVVIAPVWQLITTLLESNVQLVSVVQQGLLLELRGTAPRATEVLGVLQKMAGVSDAAFAAPTRRVNELEQFHIRLSFSVGAGNAKE